MEYLVFILAFCAFVLFVLIQGKLLDRRNEKQFAAKLRRDFGMVPDKEYKAERFLQIPTYFEKHPEEGQLDDITWNDLGMDEIFQRLDYSLSSTGEEYLYYLLRSPERTAEELEHFDKVVSYYGKKTEERVRLQLLMARLGNTGKYSLYQYLEYLTRLGRRSNGREIFFNLLFIPCVGILFVNVSLGILAVVALMMYKITSYYKIKGEIEPYVTSLAYITRLLDVAEEILKLPHETWQEEWERLKGHRNRLKSSRYGSFWLFSSNKASLTSGNPLDIIMDYIRMVFHFDIMVFNRMLSQILGTMEDIDGMVGILGYLEASVSVCLYRASLTDGWCKPDFGGTGLWAEESYHPLIEQPVKNSIRTQRGVLLTGSNASGKSTFLKTVALNAVLAQTVCTVTAQEYAAPVYRIFSSMSLRDDLESGESYYIVEIRSIKRILDAVGQGERPVLCFVDEVLRGTNTVERIAASTQILKSMAVPGCICFAATHDIELTDLLQEDYENYHFQEEIVDADVLFSYKLYPGKSTSQNAIRLLSIMGYEEEIVDRAIRQADFFRSRGIWKST